jgi:hypothetical protein
MRPHSDSLIEHSSLPTRPPQSAASSERLFRPAVRSRVLRGWPAPCFVLPSGGGPCASSSGGVFALECLAAGKPSHGNRLAFGPGFAVRRLSRASHGGPKPASPITLSYGASGFAGALATLARTITGLSDPPRGRRDWHAKGKDYSPPRTPPLRGGASQRTPPICCGTAIACYTCSRTASLAAVAV